MRMCHELMAPALGTGICSRQVIYLGPARRSNRHTVKAHCSGASGVLLQKPIESAVNGTSIRDNSSDNQCIDDHIQWRILDRR